MFWKLIFWKMNITYKDFNVICRLCLTKIDCSACMIQESITKLLDKLVYDKINKFDELPQKICSQCEERVENIVTFINQCKASCLILSSILLHEKELKNECKNYDSFDDDYKDHGQDNHLISKHQDELISTPDDLLGNIIKKNLENQHVPCKIKKVNAGIARITCKKCNLLFKSKMCLSTHYKKNVECRPFSFRIFKCEYCSKEFLSLRDKTEHENTHTGETPYNCPYCIKKFKFKTNLHRHIYGHKQKLGLVENKAAYTEKRVQLKLRCEECEKIFASRSGFQHHKLKHKGKVSSKKVEVKLSKSNNKHFLCNYCAKSFYIKGHLDVHLRVHTGERPYNCSHCDQKFKQKSVLDRHTLNHLDIRPKPFVCDICHKSFTTKAHMQIHKRLHTGEKPYQCDFCHKCFNYKTRWKMHLRIHTGESPFVCNVCNKSYHDNGSLKKHQRKKGHIPNEDLKNIDKNLILFKTKIDEKLINREEI